MDTTTVLFVFSVINGLIAVANYLSGRKTAGQQEGIILANLKTLENMISEIKLDIKEMKKRNNDFDERLTRVETQCEDMKDRVKTLEDILLREE